MLKVKEVSKSGHVVKQIFGGSDTATVFTTEDGQLRWEYHKNGGKLPESHNAQVARFNVLMSDIKRFVPEKHRYTEYALLGKCLHNGLSQSASVLPDAIFEESIKSVATVATQAVNLRYLILSLGVLIVTIVAASALLISAVLQGDWPAVITAGMFGSIGAWLSLLQRVINGKFDWRITPEAQAADGAARILIGFVFGSVVMMLSKGNLVLGLLNETHMALYVFAIIAGTSERFVPRLLGNLENSTS